MLKLYDKSEICHSNMWQDHMDGWIDGWMDNYKGLN